MMILLAYFKFLLLGAMVNRAMLTSTKAEQQRYRLWFCSNVLFDAIMRVTFQDLFHGSISSYRLLHCLTQALQRRVEEYTVVDMSFRHCT